MGRAFVIRLLLWLALSALPMVAISHAFDHPIATPDGHDHACLICGHGHNGGAPPTADALIVHPAPVAALLPAARLPAAIPLAMFRPYFGRAPPEASFA